MNTIFDLSLQIIKMKLGKVQILEIKVKINFIKIINLIIIIFTDFLIIFKYQKIIYYFIIFV